MISRSPTHFRWKATLQRMLDFALVDLTSPVMDLRSYALGQNHRASGKMAQLPFYHMFYPVFLFSGPKNSIQKYSNGMRCWNSFHQTTTTEFWPKQNLKARQEFLRVILGLASQTFSDHGAKWEVRRRLRFPTWPFCILVIQIDCEKCLDFCWGMMAAEAEWDTYYSYAAYHVFLCTLPRKGGKMMGIKAWNAHRASFVVSWLEIDGLLVGLFGMFGKS